MALWPIFEVFAQQETCYEGGGKRLPSWWLHTEVDAQLRVTIQDILAEEMESKRWESSRRGKKGEYMV